MGKWKQGSIILVILAVILGMTFSEGDFIDSKTVQTFPQIITAQEAVVYGSEDLYEKASQLSLRYPEILQLHILGSSTDGKPIYTLVLTEGIEEGSWEDLFVHKQQLLIEAGTHARETVNPFLTLKTVEDYCRDFYDPQHLPEVDVGRVLKNGTFHFLILSNPDGYDVVQKGVASIEDPVFRQNFIQLMAGIPVNELKANIGGIDLNRNYRDEYYDLEQGIWIDQFGENRSEYCSVRPSSRDYRGVCPASAVETQLVQDYIEGYSFRAVLSYHSMGEVIYYYKEHFSSNFNGEVLKPWAELAGHLSGYKLMPSEGKGAGGDGYLSHFFVNLTRRPALTIETTPEQTYPILGKYYESAYKQVYRLPYEFMQKAQAEGFGEYKVYIDGKFFQDYRERFYAQAVAEKYGGVVHGYPGRPSMAYIVADMEGEALKFSEKTGLPYLTEDDHMMIPLTALTDVLGLEVQWQPQEKKTIVFSREEAIVIAANDSRVWIDEEILTWESTSCLRDGHLYVPIKEMAKLLDLEVAYSYLNQHRVHLYDRTHV